MVLTGIVRNDIQNIVSILMNSYFNNKIQNVTGFVNSLCNTGQEYSELLNKLTYYMNNDLDALCPYNCTIAKDNILKFMSYKNKIKYINNITHDNEWANIYHYIRDNIGKMISCIYNHETYKKWYKENEDNKALRNIKVMEEQIETLKKNMKNTESDKFKLETKNRELERELKKQKEIIEFLKGINNNEPPEECNICMDKIQDKNLKCGCTTRYCMPCARKINFKCCTCKKKINNLSV